MRILAIETSCDETALSLVECSGGVNPPAGGPQFKVLQNLISTQIAVHRPFGGVVPMLAKREHIKNLPRLFRKLAAKSLQLKAVDAIAVTVGPGLEPALWQGVEFAQMLAKKFHKPLIGVNHLEGHIYSTLLPRSSIKLTARSLKLEAFGHSHAQIKFPAIGLLVSGGHTILVRMDSFTKWKKLGETRDDAAGEAFDKVGKMLGLPYPGGPEIQKLAIKGNPKAINFPRPMLNSGDYDFSFSGLKTAVLYYLRDHKLTARSLKLKADVAASFQQAVIDVLTKKAMRAAEQFGAKTIFLCGGVAANKELRHQLMGKCQRSNVNFIVPEFIFNTDNAVMIAAAAYLGKLRKKTYPIKANPNLNL
ncbi:MAG: tRNA (adenosine(37)-N6)-threonylcarbamoyltransferase complex transferase subunit TsaD [bacterium]|nr:tRNA (adenosine(37)-N6)-threonylcarbamoyltransferase complex transferase subunit TsaD [bacterium]